MTDVLKTKSRGYWFQRMVRITGGAPVKVPFFALPDMPFLLRRIRIMQADSETFAVASACTFHIWDDGISDFIVATATILGQQYNAATITTVHNATAAMSVDANGNITLSIPSGTTNSYDPIINAFEVMQVTPTGAGAGIWSLHREGNYDAGAIPTGSAAISTQPGYIAGSGNVTAAIPRIEASLYIASGLVRVWPEAPIDCVQSNLRQMSTGIQRIFQLQPADLQNYGVGWQGAAPGDNYPVNYKYAENSQIMLELTGQAVVPALIGATGANDTGMRPDYVEITIEGYNLDEGAAAP